MTLAPSLSWPSSIIHHKALLFAQKADQDLDFDDELEDMDYYDPKPPSRRPLVLIFLLLIVASVGYFVMNPGAFSSLLNPGAFSSLTSLVIAPGSKESASEATSKTSASHKKSAPAFSRQTPIPMFQEGQLVAVFVNPSGPFSLKLSGDAEGKKPGPLVKAGELLTILDGSLVNNTWTYFVHTKSGASGWISEHQLKAKS